MENPIFALETKVDPDYITNVVKQMVQAGIVQALDEKNNIAGTIIREVLEKKVDKNGHVSNYSSDNKYSLLDVCIDKVVREETKNVISEMAEELRPKLRKAIKKQMSKEAMYDKCAKLFCDCMLDNLDSNWKTNIEVNFKGKDE